MSKSMKGERRVFTEDFKRQIVKEAGEQPDGQVTKFLAGHGLAMSSYYQWKKDFQLKDAQVLNGSAPPPAPETALRPSQPQPRVSYIDEDATALRISLLEEENRRLRLMLGQIEMVWEFQEKLKAMLEAENSKANISQVRTMGAGA